MRINRLGGDDAFARIIKDVREAGRMANLGNSSVSKGRTRFVGQHSLLVEGSADIVGTLYGSNGTLQWDGPANFTEDTNIGGNLLVEALTRLLGALTLEADMTILSGGKVIVSGSDPVAFGVTSGGAPGLEWSAGGTVVGGASSVSMNFSNKRVGAGATGASLSSGANRVDVTDVATTLTGDFISNLPTITAVGKTPNVWCDPATKKFYRLI